MSMLKPTTKMRPSDANKNAGVGAHSSANEGASSAPVYRPEDGWRPVHNRMGDLTGYYHDGHGFKEDPANLMAPRDADDDAIAERVFNDPRVVEADAARQAATEAWRAAVAARAAHFAAIAAAEADASANPPATVYPTQADATNHRNGVVDYSRIDKVRQLEGLVRQFILDEDMADQAAAKASGRYHRIVAQLFADARGHIWS